MTDRSPVCLKCTKDSGLVVRYRPSKNGYVVPYTVDSVLHGDKYTCPRCGDSIVIGFALSPKYYHGEDIVDYVDEELKDIV